MSPALRVCLGLHFPPFLWKVGAVVTSLCQALSLAESRARPWEDREGLVSEMLTVGGEAGLWGIWEFSVLSSQLSANLTLF